MKTRCERFTLNDFKYKDRKDKLKIKKSVNHFTSI